MTNCLAYKLDHLKRLLHEMGPTLIAFSGGVDSSFLLAVAAVVLGDEVTALMTISPSTPPEDARQATAIAASLQIRLVTVPHNELAIPAYAANPTNRCYFCKHSLYEICRDHVKRLSLASVADGINTDDLADYRPGLQAATEYGVRHPLVEAGFDKEAIRQGSKHLGLPTWKKPASPCLSSRVPYGTPITASMLSQIARGEAFLRSLGLQECRVRHHGHSARVEIHPKEFPKIVSTAMLLQMRNQLKGLGFSAALLDLEGYRSGVFNIAVHEAGSDQTA